jgi:chromosome segregation ATPase
MNIDDIPEHFQDLVERARIVLHREISGARATLAGLKGETAAERKALADLSGQRKQTQANLDTNLANLNRASGLAGLDSEIAEARKTLKALEVEKGEASKSLEAVKKQLRDAESRLNAMQIETQQLFAQRCDSQAIMDNIRAQLRSVQLGQRP